MQREITYKIQAATNDLTGRTAAQDGHLGWHRLMLRWRDRWKVCAVQPWTQNSHTLVLLVSDKAGAAQIRWSR